MRRRRRGVQVVTTTYLALNGHLGRGVIGLPTLTQNVLLAPVRVRQRVHLVLQHYVVHLAAPVAVVTLGNVLAGLVPGVAAPQHRTHPLVKCVKWTTRTTHTTEQSTFSQVAGCCAHRPDHAAAAALPSARARPPSEAQSAQSNTSAYECLCGRRCSLF